MSYDYDVLVIGGGAAGLTASQVGAGLGARVLLVERHRLGGECTWTGCVPSKALLHAARVAHTMRQGSPGLPGREPEVDFPTLMAHVRHHSQAIYDEDDSPAAVARQGVASVLASARLVGPHEVELRVEDGPTRRVTFRYGIIATGSQPAVPDIPGLTDGPFLTNDTLFDLSELPRRLAILGAGPIGTEMAQAFQRLGSQVTVLDHHDRTLPHDDKDLADSLQALLQREGVQYRLATHVARVTYAANGDVTLHLASGDTVQAEQLLVATGRTPRLTGLGLEALGISTTSEGVRVDAYGRTTLSHLYAVGDAAAGPNFTHWCEHTARNAVTHALLKLPTKNRPDLLPWVTYTAPELAHVGATETQLRQRGTHYQSFSFPYHALDRARTDDVQNGLIRIYARTLDGKIYGASILGAAAGELISTLALAMTHGLALRHLSATLLPYPTYTLGARRAADNWAIKDVLPLVRPVVKTLFGLHGAPLL